MSFVSESTGKKDDVVTSRKLSGEKKALGRSI